MKNSVALIAGVGLLAVGYACGAYVGYPLVDKDMLEGNIGKAKVYNQTESPEVLAAMEQLANDTAYQKEVVMTTALLNGRIMLMDQLVNATLKATEGIEELKGLNEEMQAQSKRTANANAAYEAYLTEIGKVVNGEKSEAYEQAKNNAMMAFLNVENCLENAPDMINSMLCYTEGTPNDAICDLIGQWAQYSAEDAVLNYSAEDIAYWESAYNTLSNTAQLKGRSLASLAVFPSVETAIKNLEQTPVIQEEPRYYRGPVGAREILGLYHGPVNAREIIGLYNSTVRGREVLRDMAQGTDIQPSAADNLKPKYYRGPVGNKETLQSRNMGQGLNVWTMMNLRSAF